MTMMATVGLAIRPATFSQTTAGDSAATSVVITKEFGKDFGDIMYHALHYSFLNNLKLHNHGLRVHATIPKRLFAWTPI